MGGKIVRGHESIELEVQSRWFAGEFGRDFVGTDGERVRIVQFGVWNRTAGPDFVDAAFELQGCGVVRGAIEIDMDVRDWEGHGHSQNLEYNGVILHIFLARGPRRMFTRTSDHRLVTQVHLLAESKGGKTIVPIARAGRCARLLERMSLPALQREMKEAARIRFRNKATQLQRIAELHGEGEALFQGIAAAMGYPGNQLPFRLLAQRLTLKRLMEVPEDAEALLFGLAGFLPGPNLSEYLASARRYGRELWEHWWRYRASHASLVLPARVWRFGAQRPANHPMRRLGAFAQLLKQWRSFARLAAAHRWMQVRRLVIGLEHPFWSHHYTFLSVGMESSLALLGPERFNELLVNVLLPFSGDWEFLLSMKAPDRNRRSRIAAARVLGNRADALSLLGQAVYQQGVLQLYEDFCSRDASDCSNCPFPEQAQGRLISE